MKEPKMCCNCLHCARWKKKDGIECHCDLTDKYLGYLDVMNEDNDCEHWEKETKWENERKHDEEVRAKVIDEYKNNVLNEFCTYCNQEACEGGCMGSIQECATIRLLRDVMEDMAKEMKEGAENGN